MSTLPLHALSLTAGLFLGALLLATTSALALGIAFRNFALLGLLLGRALSFFPVNALAWSFIGIWVGCYGWPIWSLMPLEASKESLPLAEHAARHIWLRTPPLLLTALPLAGHLLACVLPALSHLPWPHVECGLRARGLWQAARFYRQRLPHAWPEISVHFRSAGLLAAALLILVEDAFSINGIAAPVAHALRLHDVSTILPNAAALASLAALWWLLIWRTSAWRIPSVARRAGQSSAVQDGAVIIGLSRFEAWRSHCLPVQLRHLLAWLANTAAWGVTGLTAYTSLIGVWPGAALAHTIGIAFSHPFAPLEAGLPPLLCALSFWLLGRIIAPRYPKSHGLRPR